MSHSPPRIPERVLQSVWQQRRFATAGLRTTDGRRVEILSPGSRNADSGPDFTGARIRVGNVVFAGDVELHQSAAEWQQHLHDTDQHYNRVILHVVLTADPLTPPARTASLRPVPLLVLHPYLDGTLHDALMRPLVGETEGHRKPIPCAAANDGVPAGVCKEWLVHLGRERMELKVRRFHERLTQLVDEGRPVLREPYPRYYGDPGEIPVPPREYSRRDFGSRALWEQLLYEGIMEAMGYSKNAGAFLHLAQSVRLASLRQCGLQNSTTIMAILFGSAGLLPPVRSLCSIESRRYVRMLRKHWREQRSLVRGSLLQPGDWLFFRLRPANFPTARLASMCFLLPSFFGKDGFRSFVTLCKQDDLSTTDWMQEMSGLFHIAPDGFWMRHVRFEEETSTGIAIGQDRIREITMNVLLPIGLLYARIFHELGMRDHLSALLPMLPAGSPNSTTRLVERDLLKGKMALITSLLQQGGTQLYKFYCLPGRCSECAVGMRIGFTPQ